MNNFLLKSKNLLIGVILSFLILPLFGISSFATIDASKVKPLDGESLRASKTIQASDKSGYAGSSDVLDKVTLSQAQNKIEEKGFDIIHLLQIIAKPFAIVMFIASAFVSFFAFFGHGGLLSKGLLGMLIAGVMYTAIMYAPQLIDFINTWLSK